VRSELKCRFRRFLRHEIKKDFYEAATTWIEEVQAQGNLFKMGGPKVKRIYVAGAYSADNVLDVLKNIGRGERLAAEVFRAGFAPFCPWNDKDFIIQQPDFKYTVQMFYQYSIAWLKVSDGLILVPGWEYSWGTAEEIKISKALDLPIFYDIREMKVFFRKILDKERYI
jgi:hypothetical protein